MSFVCLRTPGGSTAAASGAEARARSAASLLEVVPRVRLGERGLVWADARGLPLERTAAALLERWGGEACAGVSRVPVAAECAARSLAPGADETVRIVPPGGERDFLAPLPLALLAPDERLLARFESVGIGTCGELAALEREPVEVRFGAEGARLWRLARADDRRRIFGPVPRERPHASIDFADYVVRDPARLVFTANALLGSVCDALRSRGEHARRITLGLSLASGESREWTLRPARPTASRERWLRLIRGRIDRLTVPDAIVGVALRVESMEPAAAVQGDLFDRGFATASAVEAAIARLLESGALRAPGSRIADRGSPEIPARLPSGGRAAPKADSPLEHAPATNGSDPRSAAGRSPASRDRGAEGAPRAALTLQLLDEPVPIEVEAVPRRDHAVPVRFRDRRGWREVASAAGPDRISGGQWEEEPFAREYFRCVTGGGVLVWIFRDALAGGWWLHGWWD